MRLQLMRYAASAIVVMLATASHAQNRSEDFRKKMEQLDRDGAQAFELLYMARERALIDKCGAQFAAINPSQHKQKWAKVRNKPAALEGGEPPMKTYRRHASGLSKPGACMAAADDFRTKEAIRDVLKGIRLK